MRRIGAVRSLKLRIGKLHCLGHATPISIFLTKPPHLNAELPPDPLLDLGLDLVAEALPEEGQLAEEGVLLLRLPPPPLQPRNLLPQGDHVLRALTTARTDRGLKLIDPNESNRFASVELA